MTNEQSDRIIRIKTVIQRTGLTRSTIYRNINADTFPRQISISTRCAGWRESAVTDSMRNPMFYEARPNDPSS